MSTTESQLRAELGIPDTAKRVIILASTAHLDWDWISTFWGYYSTTQKFDYENYAVRDIFNNAATYLDASKNNGAQTCTEANPAQPPPYYYSIAEIGYLQEFAVDPLGSFQTLQDVGGLLRIVGGGITSPDNLLSHGETFLRNFLIANTWLLSVFPAQPSSGLPPLPPLQQVWTPDDFGHDSQFPILMEAMGLQGVGFSRIPGDPQQYWTFVPEQPGLSGGHDMAASMLVLGLPKGRNKGVDFIWQASDGSTTIAHFMQAGYFQGAGIDKEDTEPVQNIQSYYDMNQGASPTPYIFVPVGVDFSLPVEDLVQYACAWNAQNLATTGVYAVAATFDHYVQLVNCHQDKLLTRSSNPDSTFLFVPAPYWTGCYASRPEIKIQHQRATRNLLGAELFSVIAGFLSVPDPDNLPQLISLGWQQLTPSTHHDYITGTASNTVYQGEQLKFLSDAVGYGDTALNLVQQNIAAQVGSSIDDDQIAVTVFNQLGFARGGVVEMKAVPKFTPVAFGNENGILGPVQISFDNTWLFCIPADEASNVPPLGYNTYYLTSDKSVTVPPYNPPLAVSQSSDQQTISLSNAFLSATLTSEADWGIASLDEIVGGVASSVLQGPANQAIYFAEGPPIIEPISPGNMYKFATEYGVSFSGELAAFFPAAVQILEEGPVRVRLRLIGSYTVNGAKQQLTREYLLLVDEPMLRMRTTGAAPQPYSVFVAFPLSESGNIDSMVHGTSYHWDTKPSQPVVNNYRQWTPPIFSATHDFVIPSSSGNSLGAIYHAHLPAWAITADNNSVIGCLLRNPTNDKPPSSTEGGDPDSHTVDYALRVPQGLGDPTSGNPQCESLSYTTPLTAKLGGSANGSLPSSFSMGGLSESYSFVTAVKAGTNPARSVGEIIIRIYQPTLTGQQLTLTLPPAPSGYLWQAYGITALETSLSADKQTTLNAVVTGNQVSFFAERALTTLSVSLTTSE